jgi:hypothetical protein
VQDKKAEYEGTNNKGAITKYTESVKLESDHWQKEGAENILASEH